MKHYTAEQWADFARGVVGTRDKSIMQSHLDSGCRTCAKELGLWQRVTQAAKRQVAVEPSESAVRQAKAMLVTHGFKPLGKSKPTVAELLFDSMRGPAPVGVRSGPRQPRQLLFGVAEHRIDLRMEPKIDSEIVSIVGQVLDAANPGKPPQNVPVSLHLGKKVVAESETNHLGEFQLECMPVGRLELRATLPQGREISVALIEPAAPPQHGVPYMLDSIREKRVLRGRKKRTRKKV